MATCNNLLSRPGLADDEHISIGLGEVQHSATHHIHRGGYPKNAGLDRLLILQFGLQGIEFKRQSPLLDSAPDGSEELVGSKRLLDEVVGPVPHCPNGHAYVAMPRDKNDGHVGIQLMQSLLQLQTIHTAH